MQRENREKQYMWERADLYANEQEWEKAYQFVQSGMKRFATLKGRLSEPSICAECLDLDQALSLQLERLYVYSALQKDEDTRRSDAQRLVEKASGLSTKYSEATSFIVPELLTIDKKRWEEMFEECEGLETYRKMIRDIMRAKDHILSEKEEALLAALGDTYGVGSDVFSVMNDADMTFPDVELETGEKVRLTKSTYMTYMESNDRQLRERAYKTFYRTYMQWKQTIGTTLYANIKEIVTHAKIKHYPSALEKALFWNDVPVSVYHNLIRTTKQNAHHLQRYLDVRKRVLGLDELRMWDIYTPIVANQRDTISYEEAYAKMVEGLHVLGEDYVALLQQAKKDRWIDVYENEGKRGGAYSWGAYGTHPYVLLNHRSDMDSLFTLAHEMGHALHSHYSDANNPYHEAQYTIFVAEVASTVNEVLLIRHMIDEAKAAGDTPKEAYLINHFLEQFRGTLFRQVLFAEFEYLTHKAVEAGEALTHEDFRDIYRSLHETYYGKGVVHDEEIAYEWMRIPHFYNSFYVYQYATGFSAAIAIADGILTEGESAVTKYKAFLASGGTDFPIELLKIAGVDMRTSKPVEQALSYFGKLVDRFEELQQ